MLHSLKGSRAWQAKTKRCHSCFALYNPNSLRSLPPDTDIYPTWVLHLKINASYVFKIISTYLYFRIIGGKYFVSISLHFKVTAYLLLLACKIFSKIPSWFIETALLPLCCRHTPSQLAGQRVGVFSYGSGFAATLYSLRVTQDHTPGKSVTIPLSCVILIIMMITSKGVCSSMWLVHCLLQDLVWINLCPALVTWTCDWTRGRRYCLLSSLRTWSWERRHTT